MKSEFIGFSYDCCKKCTDDRYPGCHGSCEKYLKIKAKNDELKEARKLDNDKRYISKNAIKNFQKHVKRRDKGYKFNDY